MSSPRSSCGRWRFAHELPLVRSVDEGPGEDLRDGRGQRGTAVGVSSPARSAFIASSTTRPFPASPTMTARMNGPDGGRRRADGALADHGARARARGQQVRR